jgi:hypothetical protein
MSHNPIKPCRCGREVKLERLDNKHQIQCYRCFINTGWQFDRKKVIEAWNNRPEEDAKDKRIEELEPLLEDALRALEHADFLLGPENNSVPLSNQCLFRRGVIRRANEL